MSEEDKKLERLETLDDSDLQRYYIIAQAVQDSRWMDAHSWCLVFLPEDIDLLDYVEYGIIIDA